MYDVLPEGGGVIVSIGMGKHATTHLALALPLRQRVHVRASRLVMWTDAPPSGVGGMASASADTDADSLGEPISDRARPLEAVGPLEGPAAQLAVRRRLPWGYS